MTIKELKYLLLIIVIFIAACMETDIYLPAFSDMMQFFSASEEQIQSLLTWNFIGICVSGPIYGPVSDAFGRKKPLLVALGLFLVGSIITLFAQNFDSLLFGRLLQGLGSGGCFTLGIAIIFDSFQAQNAVRALNQLNTIMPFIMAGAPLLGGYLNCLYGFRSNFLAIAILVFLSFVITLCFLEEPLAKEKRAPFEAKKILRDFKQAFTNLPFWLLTVVLSFLFAAYLTFLSGTAVLFVVDFEVSKQLFPWYQAALVGTWLLANLTFNRAIAKWGNLKVKMIGMLLVAIGGLGLGIVSLIAPQNPELLTTAMMVFTVGCNWINGLYFPDSMELLPDIKGVMASLQTSARLLITAFTVGLASAFYNATIYPLAIAVVTITVTLLPLIFLYEKRSPKNVSLSPQ